MKKWLILIAVAGLAGLAAEDGCQDKQAEVGPTAITPSKPGRFTIVSHGSFNAGYCAHEREIVVITDTQTKREYLGITGVGVTELYRSGKSTTEE